MIATALGARRDPYERTQALAWWTVYLVAVGSGLLIAAIARRAIFVPYLGVSLGLLALLLVGWLVGPRPTLYVMLTLTAISDSVTTYWFPFAKNLSSPESIAFVADPLTISPLDAMLGVGLVVSVVRQYARHRRLVAPSRTSRVVMVFAAFVVYGFANGIVRGAPIRIAVIESRPVFYIAVVFVIATNELVEAAHARRAVFAVIVGVFIQSLLSIEYYMRIPAAARAGLDGLNEHGAALGHGLVLLSLILMVIVSGGLRGRSALVALAAIPTTFVFGISQRRAGFGALVIALAIAAVVLFWRRRTAFWVLVPAGFVGLAAYTLAFWNTTGPAGFAAQAVKGLVAPDQLSYEDQSSDLYRTIEAYDLWFTIRASRIRGLGFGHPFYRPVALPAISDFELAAYVPHNSILWVWIKLGFLGFVAMFAMFGRALMVAAEHIRTTADHADMVVTTIAAGFVAMYVVFTWFDISWDARNTVFVGLMLAICGRAGAPDQSATAAATTPARRSA